MQYITWSSQAIERFSVEPLRRVKVWAGAYFLTFLTVLAPASAVAIPNGSFGKDQPAQQHHESLSDLEFCIKNSRYVCLTITFNVPNQRTHDADTRLNLRVS